MKTLLFLLFSFFIYAAPAMAMINPNTASATELTQFNGVGPKTAAKIIAYREANGPFASCDDLVKVKGIGAKTVQKLKPDCNIDAKQGAKNNKEKAASQSSDKSKTTTGQSNGKGINPNTASVTELTQFNGVGPKTAANIIAYREANGPFASCDDLVKVRGIGAKTIQKIKPDCATSTTKKK